MTLVAHYIISNKWTNYTGWYQKIKEHGMPGSPIGR